MRQCETNSSAETGCRAVQDRDFAASRKLATQRDSLVERRDEKSLHPAAASAADTARAPRP